MLKTDVISMTITEDGYQHDSAGKCSAPYRNSASPPQSKLPKAHRNKVADHPTHFIASICKQLHWMP